MLLCLPATATMAEDNEFSSMHLDELIDVKVFASSVFSAHVHEAGDVMLGHDFMQMHMDGNAVDSREVSVAALLDPNGQYGYMIAPEHR